MDRDSRAMRGTKPVVFTNCMTGDGVDEVLKIVEHELLFDL